MRGKDRECKWTPTLASRIFISMALSAAKSALISRQQRGSILTVSNLTLNWQSDGPRYYVDGEPVHAGDLLEVQLDDGSWVVVRFEYHWDKKQNTIDPFLIIADGQLLPADSLCRWPD